MSKKSLEKIRNRIHSILREYGIKASILSVKHVPGKNLYEGKMRITSLGIIYDRLRKHRRYRDYVKDIGDVLKIIDKMKFEYSFFYYGDNRYTLLFSINLKTIRYGRRIEHVVINLFIYIAKTTKVYEARAELYGFIAYYMSRGSRLPCGSASYSIKVKAEPITRHKLLVKYMKK